VAQHDSLITPAVPLSSESVTLALTSYGSAHDTYDTSFFKILLKNHFSPCYILCNLLNLFYWLYYLREKIELSTLAVKYNASWLTNLSA
jgi:hypothetical protein